MTEARTISPAETETKRLEKLAADQAAWKIKERLRQKTIREKVLTEKRTVRAEQKAHAEDVAKTFDCELLALTVRAAIAGSLCTTKDITPPWLSLWSSLGGT